MLVGGLGLGYTAREVLACTDVQRLVVIELLDGILDWQRNDLVPHSQELRDDERCELRRGDFFAAMSGPPVPGETWDAILLDIDHAPSALLRGSPAEFYQRGGLRRLAEHLAPSGVFAVWSADTVDDDFVGELRAVFADVRAEEITFGNPMLDREDTNVIYVAQL